MAKPAEFTRLRRRLEEIESYRVAFGRIHVLARASGTAAKSVHQLYEGIFPPQSSLVAAPLPIQALLTLGA
jgi:hypothetical protein